MFIANTAFATTYYVRDGGGTRAQCTGTTDHTLSGAVGTACSLKNPMLVGGWGCSNGGNGTCATSGLWTNGDTMSISGDSDTSPGTQAQYKIGYDSGGTTPGCGASTAVDCTMSNIPTNGTIVGTGTFKPQLWGTEKIHQVINMHNSGSTVNNVEITDHSSCILFGPDPGSTTDGFPTVCQRDVSPYGPFAEDGIDMSGSNNTIENSWIHGISHYGIVTQSYVNYIDRNNIVSGNGLAGIALADSMSTAVLNGTTIDSDVIAFSGCGEHYPMVSSNWLNTANYHHCWDQNSGGIGLGDGLGEQADSASCGTVNITNTRLLFNMQDGADFLHCYNDAGTFNVIRTRSEGNEGQAFKFNGGRVNFENSQAIGDCAFFLGRPFTTTKTTSGANLDPHGAAGICRANGDTIAVKTRSNGVYNFYNSTVVSNGNSAFLLDDTGVPCNSNTRVNLVNNLVIGGDNYNYYYTGASNPVVQFYDNETSCNSINENYNLVYNANGAVKATGNHDSIANPQITGTLKQTNPNWYQGIDYADQLYPASGSPLIGAANSVLTLTGTSNDYNNVSRGSLWDKGSYQFGSLVPSGGQCNNTAECANQTCTNNVCGGSVCTAVGNSCLVNGNCCTNSCVTNICANVTTANGGSCFVDSNCTSGHCCSSICSANACAVQVCGNGTIESPEGCDDGNLTNGDGCSSLCQVEAPNELPLTYMKNDPLSNMTLFTNSINVTNLDRNSNTSLVKDFGANFFGNFSHTTSVDVSACTDNGGAGASRGLVGFWALTANVEADISAMKANLDGVFAYFSCVGGVYKWNLGTATSGVTEVTYTDLAPDVSRYLVFDRTGTALTMKIYTDSSLANLLSTLSITDGTKYRYFHYTDSSNVGDTGSPVSAHIGITTLSNTGSSCGDSICQANETCFSCPGDCSVCPISQVGKCLINGSGKITGSGRLN